MQVIEPCMICQSTVHLHEKPGLHSAQHHVTYHWVLGSHPVHSGATRVCWLNFHSCSFCRSSSYSQGAVQALENPLRLKSSSQGETLGEGWEWNSYFHKPLCSRKLPVTASHVSLVYWQGTFLLRSSFVLSKYNLCRTWSADNVDDPVFHAEFPVKILLSFPGPEFHFSAKEKKKRNEKKRNNRDKFRHWWEKSNCSPSTLGSHAQQATSLTFPGIPSHTG